MTDNALANLEKARERLIQHLDVMTGAGPSNASPVSTLAGALRDVDHVIRAEEYTRHRAQRGSVERVGRVRPRG